MDRGDRGGAFDSNSSSDPQGFESLVSVMVGT
jgi:hypothetical protein